MRYIESTLNSQFRKNNHDVPGELETLLDGAPILVMKEIGAQPSAEQKNNGTPGFQKRHHLVAVYHTVLKPQINKIHAFRV